jgi:hypothetical protein
VPDMARSHSRDVWIAWFTSKEMVVAVVPSFNLWRRWIAQTSWLGRVLVVS